MNMTRFDKSFDRELRTERLTAGKRGFTLLETLVAVAILALAVSGPIYVANRVLVAAQVAKEQLTASYLAQEGVEYMRNMRDHEFLAAYASGSQTASEDAWTHFTAGDSSHTGAITRCIAAPCSLDPARPMGFGALASIRNCATTCPLYVIASTGQYTLASSGATLTPYTRKISATIVSSNDVRITSTVTWSNRGNPYTVTVTSHLTPWQ